MSSSTTSDDHVSDEVTDERFAYYVAINNVLGLIGAFGSQRLADEGLLLSAFRRFLSTRPSSRIHSPASRYDMPEKICGYRYVCGDFGRRSLRAMISEKVVGSTIVIHANESADGRSFKPTTSVVTGPSAYESVSS